MFVFEKLCFFCKTKNLLSAKKQHWSDCLGLTTLVITSWGENSKYWVALNKTPGSASLVWGIWVRDMLKKKREKTATKNIQKNQQTEMLEVSFRATTKPRELRTAQDLWQWAKKPFQSIREKRNNLCPLHTCIHKA